MSPFLGDELSVNHQDFISPLEVARATGLAVGAPHITCDGAHHTSRFGYARDGFGFDGARYPLGWAQKSASHGELSRAVRDEVAVLFRDAWGAVDPIMPPQPVISLKTDLGHMGDIGPTAASWVMAADPETISCDESLVSLPEDALEEGHPPLDRQESGWTTRPSISAQPAHLVDLSGFGEGGPRRPSAISIGGSGVGGGGRPRNCGMKARSTSSLDMLENKHDYGRRAVRTKSGGGVDDHNFPKLRVDVLV